MVFETPVCALGRTGGDPPKIECFIHFPVDKLFINIMESGRVADASSPCVAIVTAALARSLSPNAASASPLRMSVCPTHQHLDAPPLLN